MLQLMKMKSEPASVALLAIHPLASQCCLVRQASEKRRHSLAVAVKKNAAAVMPPIHHTWVPVETATLPGHGGCHRWKADHFAWIQNQ